MLSQVIWWTAILLEALILFRSLQAGLLKRYPLFYSYLSFVFVDELLRFFVYRVLPGGYDGLYWVTQFLSLPIGCAVIFEVYRVGLRSFPGTARMARNLLLFVFAMVFAKAVVNVWNGTSLWSAATNLELERNLRIVQSCSLLAIVIAFLVYSIPLSRNLKGILLGYGIFLGASIVQLTFMDLFGVKIAAIWPYLQPASYLMVLCVWTAALWSRSKEPASKRADRLEEDYRKLVAATHRRLEQSRAALSRAVRP